MSRRDRTSDEWARTDALAVGLVDASLVPGARGTIRELHSALDEVIRLQGLQDGMSARHDIVILTLAMMSPPKHPYR